MSIGVSSDELFEEVAEWGSGFLTTVGPDQRPRLIALRPSVADVDGTPVLRFAHAGRSACTNVAERAGVTIAFAPHARSDGFSLIVDGNATADSESNVIDVVPTSAVRHRPAPDVD